MPKLIPSHPDNLALAGETAGAIAGPPPAAPPPAAQPAAPRGGIRPAPAIRRRPPWPLPVPPPPLPVRSAERRRWSAELTSPGVTGLVLHGTGGIGKSVLAGQITVRVSSLEPARRITVLSGELTAGSLLAGLIAALRRLPPAAAPGSAVRQAVRQAGRPGLPWPDRLAALQAGPLSRVPMLAVLDDFDDNLTMESGCWAIRDPDLASLLAGWGHPAQLGRLLVTCRHPFQLPGATGPGLALRHVGPLSPSGARELASSLPALRRLGPRDIELAWRLVGGHPHAMRYLDALLAAGAGDFAGLARRLGRGIWTRTGQPRLRTGPIAPTELPPAVAEAVAQAASDLLLADLLSRLSARAQSLLIRASVYRVPVSRGALGAAATHGGPPGGDLGQLLAECAATGLLTAGPGARHSAVVHRWTAGELHRRLGQAGHGQEIAGAHRAAAQYWQSHRPAGSAAASRAGREASYHQARADALGPAAQPAPGPATGRNRSRPPGLLTVAIALTALLTALATGAYAAQSAAALRAAVPRAGPASRASAVLDRAAAIRGRAATWVAAQVSRDAIVACGPAMCPVLLAHGVPPGNLAELGPGAPDPLGCDVVLATGVLRSQFGSRLASVYAPGVLASFGTGPSRIEVRAVALDGAPPGGPRAGPIWPAAGRPAGCCWVTRGSAPPARPAVPCALAGWTRGC